VTFNLSGSYNDTRIEDPALEVSPCFSCTVTNPIDPNTGLARINGNPLPEAAKWVGDLGLKYEYPLPDGSAVYGYTDMSTRSGMNLFLYESKEFLLQPLTAVGLRLGYTWASDKYDVAVFCRNCTNQIRAIGGIDFDNLTGYINDPRIFGAQFRAKF
jgi:iron complex outermembrane recepter protein